jgi:hypothetical protein
MTPHILLIKKLRFDIAYAKMNIRILIDSYGKDLYPPPFLQ